VGQDGRRLAKRHGDTRISLLREQGIPAERLVGLLAWSCGLTPTSQPIAARDLIDSFSLKALPPEPLVFTPAMWNEIAG
jgi:glutamyl-tRNA synthetase